MKLSVQDAAAFLELPDGKLYKWIKDGTLPAYKSNDRYWFNRAELLEWATSRGLHVSPRIFEEPEGGADADLVSEAIGRGGVRHHVAGQTKDEVLREVVAGLTLPEGLEAEPLLHMLLAREALGSTSISEGIAVPHVRRPIVLPVDEPIVSLAFLAEPIDFEAIDGKPVTVLFTLITPTVRAHLRVLARIAHLLHDAPFRKALAAQAPAETLLGIMRDVEQRAEKK